MLFNHGCGAALNSECAWNLSEEMGTDVKAGQSKREKIVTSSELGKDGICGSVGNLDWF